MPLLAGGAGARQMGQATFPEIPVAEAQRFAPSILSWPVAA